MSRLISYTNAMRQGAPIIDAHIVVGRDPNRGHDIRTAEQVVAEMDRHGVALSIARPRPDAVALYNEDGNTECLTASPRIKVLITISPWTISRDAVTEFRRTNEAGAVGLYLDPTRQGFLPTDSVAAHLLELAIAYKW